MKKLIILFLFCASLSNIAFAEQTSVKIVPAQNIKTCYDEIEVGDKIKFKVLNDIYKNERLYIKKGTEIIGIVDHLKDNGWLGDSAEINLKTFIIKDVNGNIIKTNSDLKINGFQELKYLYPQKERFFQYAGLMFRGKEIDINPTEDISKFNIWLNY